MGLKQMKKNCSLLLLVFLLQWGLMSAASAQPFSCQKLDPNRVGWTSLLFQARSFLVTITIKLELESLPASSVEPALISSPEGVAVKISAPPIYRATVHTTIAPLLRSTVMLRRQVWFDPLMPSALQAIRLRRGEDDFEKTYRFTRQGAYRFRRQPADRRELILPPEKWTDVKASFYPYDLNQIECPPVSEAAMIPYIVAAREPSQDSEPLDLCVFHKRLVHHVHLEPGGLQQLGVNYVRTLQQEETQTQALVDALPVTLASRPLSSIPGEEEVFSFLGLRGDVVIYLDTHSRMPLQISGQIPTFGKVDLRLIRAEVRTKDCEKEEP